MALQKQIVRMSAQGGLDTKSDEKNVLSTNYLELENIVFTKTGAFSKRKGYAAYSDAILESLNRITTGQAATTFKNELLRYSDTTLYSYSDAEAKWSNKGDVRFALSSEFGVTSNGKKNTNPSHDTYGNLTCYVYERANIAFLDVEYRIVDNVTGSVIYTGEIISARSPSVVAIQGKFFIFYYDSGTVYFRTIDFSTPSTLSASSLAITSSTNNYDVEHIGNRAYIVTAGTTGINVAFINLAGTVSGPFNVADAGTFNVYSVSAEQGNSVRLVYGKSTASTLKTVLYSADLNYQIHAPVTLQASEAVINLGAVQDPSDANSSQIYVSSKTSAPYKLSKYVVTSAGAVSSSGTLMYQATLQSKPQSYGTKVYFALCKNTSVMAAGSPYVVFRTYFMADQDGSVVTKFGVDSGIFRTLAQLPKLNVEDTKLCFLGGEAAEVQVNTSTANVNVPTKIKKYCADFNQSNNYFDATLGDNLHVSGGILRMYDGSSVVEHSFLLTPEAPKFVSEVNTFDSLVVPGTYQYVVVYAWIDKAGQIHRSTPSIPLTHVVATNNKTITISMPTLPFSKKSHVEIELYRTEANGTTFYKKAYTFADRTENDETFETTSVTDNLSDGELISNEVLYTTGGVLENTAADSSKYVATYKGRVFLLGSNGYTLQYSKKREQNGPVEFAAELKIVLDEAGGPGTCLKVLGDHIIIFKENAIFALTGEGPNALGEQDDFREPYKLPSDVGCTDPNSIVETPEGLLFKSSKGIYKLNNGFGVEYIGAPVEGYNDLSITSATLIPNTNEVRFTTNSDRALVYDYYHKFWTTFTNIDAIDAVIFNGTYTYLRSNGLLMRETPDAYTDNGSYITTKIVSAWIQMLATNSGLVSGGIQGFQRFYKMLILGSYKNKHLLKVKFAYNFNPAWVQEATIDAGTVLDPEVYGDSVYGSTTYGGSYPLYQFKIYPEIQKCQAFKFSIQDFKTDEDGESFSLSNFAAQIGIKQGSAKVPTAQSTGAS